MGDKRDIGRYEAPELWSLLGLGIGIVFASFQTCGMTFVFRALLYSVVRYPMAIGPRCFRCLIFMLSGPVELLVLDSFMAC